MKRSRVFPWKCTIFLSLLPSQRAIIKHFLPWIVFVNGVELWCVAIKHLGTHLFTRTGRRRIISVHKLELDAPLPSIIALSTSSTEVFNRNSLSTSASYDEYDLPQVLWLLKQDRLAATTRLRRTMFLLRELCWQDKREILLTVEFPNLWHFGLLICFNRKPYIRWRKFLCSIKTAMMFMPMSLQVGKYSSKG